MRILGIDPGRKYTGWVVMEDYKLINYGCIETAGIHYEHSFHYIIGGIKMHLWNYCNRGLDVELACERAFKSPGLNTAALQVVVQCIKEWAKRCKLPLAMYSSTEWKKSLTGNSKADKGEVARCVRIHYPELPEDTSEHVYSAIGIAMNHQNVRQLESMAMK